MLSPVLGLSLGLLGFSGVCGVSGFSGSFTLFENGEIHFINHASNLTEIEVGKLFDRFYTVNNARNSTGLGLSISKALVEKMNGTISAEYNNEMLNICIVFDL